MQLRCMQKSVSRTYTPLSAFKGRLTRMSELFTQAVATAAKGSVDIKHNPLLAQVKAGGPCC